MVERKEAPTVTMRVNMTIAVVDADKPETVQMGVLKYWGNQGQMCVVLNDPDLKPTYTEKGLG